MDQANDYLLRNFSAAPGGFEAVVAQWRSQLEQTGFAYDRPPIPLRSVVMGHFSGLAQPFYGVYIIRRQETDEVLYIGKGGTLHNKGQYRGQDVRGRLLAVRHKDEAGKWVTAEAWFGSLAREYGPLGIECLRAQPLSAPDFVAPALIEAHLLQAFFAEHRRLPQRNRSF